MSNERFFILHAGMFVYLAIYLQLRHWRAVRCPRASCPFTCLSKVWSGDCQWVCKQRQIALAFLCCYLGQSPCSDPLRVFSRVRVCSPQTSLYASILCCVSPLQLSSWGSRLMPVPQRQSKVLYTGLFEHASDTGHANGFPIVSTTRCSRFLRKPSYIRNLGCLWINLLGRF